MTVLVNLVVAVGVLAVVPVGLRLIDGPELRLVRRYWVVGAVPGAASLWLPRGWPATVLAAVYAALTVALAAQAPRRLARLRSAWPTRPAQRSTPAAPVRHPPAVETVLQASHAPAVEAALPVHQAPPVQAASPARSPKLLRRPGSTTSTRPNLPAEVAVLTALLAPAVAATALVAERAGYRLFGFTLEILALTVPHLHFAGFAAALVAGLVCRATPGRPMGDAAALSVPAGTAIVLAGYFVDDTVELAGAAVLTAGMWAVAWLTWREIRPRASDRTTRIMLAVSALTLTVTMVLALDWAVAEAAGEAVGVPHLSLTWMAATHGVANALGFAVCAVLAWRRMASWTS